MYLHAIADFYFWKSFEKVFLSHTLYFFHFLIMHFIVLFFI